MKEHEYPHDLYAVRDRVTLRYLEGMVKRFDIMADVTLHTDEPCYPVTLKGHLVYPIGTFHTVLSTPEIEYALSHGHILEVNKACLYLRGDIFSSYVDYFYRLKAKYKQEGNKPYYMLVKLMLNSLYGKTGQRERGFEPYEGDETKLRGTSVILDLGTGKRQTLHKFGGQYFIEVDRGESYNSFPAIAAHVTAYGRMALWDLFKIAGPGHVFYCDTDSLIVDAPGKEKLESYLDDDKLGALKVEGESDTLTVVAPKHYVFEGKLTLKGVGKHDKPLGDDTWECTQFPSFRTQARWAKGTPFHTSQVIKRISGTLTDGIVNPDGWVTPLVADGLQEGPPLPSQNLDRVFQIDAQIDALRESISLEWRTIFQVYDPVRGTWKRGRDNFGNLVPLEYSEWDSKATELGYSSLADFQEDVVNTVNTYREVYNLERQRYELLHPTPPNPHDLDLFSQVPF